MDLKDLIPISDVVLHSRDLSQLKTWCRLGAMGPFNDLEIFRMINSLEYFRVFLERLKNTQIIPNGEIDELLSKGCIYRRK